MQQKMKVALLGGTGKSGKYLSAELIKRGISIRMLHRNPENLVLDKCIELIRGDARDYAAVRSTLLGCSAVISTLGQPKGESSIFSQASINILRAMNELDIQRYIVTTGLNVDTPFDKKGVKTKMGTDWLKANYPNTTADKQVEYEMLVESNVEWTLVRLPLIELTDVAGEVITSLEDCPGDKITAGDLANFLIDQVNDPTFLRKSPFIANKN